MPSSLESVSGGENVARYSFVGANPAVVIRARDGKVAVHENGAVEEAEGDPLSVLKSVMARYTPVPAPEELKLPRFHGGGRSDSWGTTRFAFLIAFP